MEFLLYRLQGDDGRKNFMDNHIDKTVYHVLCFEIVLLQE